MKKKMRVVLTITGLSFLLAVGLALAGTKVADVIRMEHKDAFAKHTKGIVMFTHKKHHEEYKLDCGECHHDDKGVPLKLKPGDDVKPCLECHLKGKADRKALKGLSKDAKKKEMVRYYYGAIHENCKGCHEEFNKKKTGSARKGPAPVSCTKCHPKKAR